MSNIDVLGVIFVVVVPGLILLSFYYAVRRHFLEELYDLCNACCEVSSVEDVRGELELLSREAETGYVLARKSLRELYRIRSNMLVYYRVHLQRKEHRELGELPMPPPFWRFLVEVVIGVIGGMATGVILAPPPSEQGGLAPSEDGRSADAGSDERGAN